MTDFPDWQTPQAHATAIFNTTVPLGIKPVNVFSASNILGASGSTRLANTLPVEQPSYQLYIGFQLPTNLGTVPFGKVTVTWQDSASGFTAQPDTFILPAGQLAFCFYLITGPARGDVVTVDLANLDPNQLLDYNISLTAISHLYTQTRLIQTDTAAVVGFTQPGKNAQAGILASTAPNVTPGNNQDRLAAAWLGQAVLVVDNVGQANGALVLITDPGLITGAGMLYGTAASGVIAIANVAAGASTTATIALPAGPVNVRINNTGATGNIAPTVTLSRIDH